MDGSVPPPWEVRIGWCVEIASPNPRDTALPRLAALLCDEGVAAAARRLRVGVLRDFEGRLDELLRVMYRRTLEKLHGYLVHDDRDAVLGEQGSLHTRLKEHGELFAKSVSVK